MYKLQNMFENEMSTLFKMRRTMEMLGKTLFYYVSVHFENGHTKKHPLNVIGTKTNPLYKNQNTSKAFLRSY